MPLNLILGAAAVLFLFFLYFLPVIVAEARHHGQTNSITVVTLFLGWTFFGWVVALAWAFSDNIERRAISSRS